MTKDEVLEEAEILCKEFINKVETGRARSKETYAACKDLARHIKAVKECKHPDRLYPGSDICADCGSVIGY